jgi:hypothetical protein
MIELGSITRVEEPFLAEFEEDRSVQAHGLCTAELAECTCPDFCERDHDTD